MTRATWVDAPAEDVWPWLAQTGRGAGWYSYDRLDNRGRISARHLVTWIPAPRPGDASPIGYLRSVEPGRSFAWWFGGERTFGTTMRAVMQYHVVPAGARSRIIVRMQVDARGVLAWPGIWSFRLADSIMARRQLIGLRERVERHGTRRADPEAPETGATDQYQRYHAILADGTSVGVPGCGDAPRWRQAAIDDGVLPD